MEIKGEGGMAEYYEPAALEMKALARFGARGQSKARTSLLLEK